MKTVIQTLSFLSLFILLSGSSSIDENERFLSLLDKEWHYELSQSPVYATAMGEKGYETEWQDLSLEAINLRKTHSVELLEKLKVFNPKKLTTDNQLNLRLFQQLTEIEIETSEYKRHLLPFSHRGGIQLAHEDAEVLPLDTIKDYMDVLIPIEVNNGLSSVVY